MTFPVDINANQPRPTSFWLPIFYLTLPYQAKVLTHLCENVCSQKVEEM